MILKARAFKNPRFSYPTLERAFLKPGVYPGPIKVLALSGSQWKSARFCEIVQNLTNPPAALSRAFRVKYDQNYGLS